VSDRSALPAPFQISELIQPAPGRLRVRVPALYRSTLAKQRIETRRRDGGAILAVYANPLTARVLILFEVSVAPEQVLRCSGWRYRQLLCKSSLHTSHRMAQQEMASPAARRHQRSPIPHRRSIRHGMRAPQPRPCISMTAR
jgi:hypothetical protein